MFSRHPFQFGILAVLSILGCLSIFEALWWNNARQSYPSVLVEDPPHGANDLFTLRAACGQPLEVETYTSSSALVRCGTWWPVRSVWIVPKSHVEPSRHK